MDDCRATDKRSLNRTCGNLYDLTKTVRRVAVTQMVADSGRDPKVSTALVADWPKAIDIENDIIKQGINDRFQRELRSALRTRHLLDCIEQRVPTPQDILRMNPDATESEVQDHLDILLTTRVTLMYPCLS